MKFLLALLFLASPAFAQELELTDVASPAEIYGDMLQEGARLEDSLDLGFDFGASIGLASPRQASVYVLVSKSQQHLWVYVNGGLYGDWAVSTGTEQTRCPPNGNCYLAHTPTGVFTPKSMHYTYTSRLWDARMDRAIFLVGGIALHATYGDHIAMLGRRDSGGCVRQHPSNADRLYRLVSQFGRKNTRVQIVER